MNSSQSNPDPERNPLTVAHGRKLLDQSKAIFVQLKELAPLLSLLDQTALDADQDPIVQIMRLLETLAEHSQRQTVLLQEIDGKLQFLLADSSISER
jgi:hypothetical protein